MPWFVREFRQRYSAPYIESGYAPPYGGGPPERYERVLSPAHPIGPTPAEQISTFLNQYEDEILEFRLAGETTVHYRADRELTT